VRIGGEVVMRLCDRDRARWILYVQYDTILDHYFSS
jgi:hypothetical protein